jgi:hypothetical protein
MFLGTSRIWWILSGVLFLAGLGLIGTGSYGMGGGIGGLLLILLAVLTFAAAPMRYGRDKPKPADAAPPPPAPKSPPPPPPAPRGPRPEIEGRDASEV